MGRTNWFGIVCRVFSLACVALSALLAAWAYSDSKVRELRALFWIPLPLGAVAFGLSFLARRVGPDTAGGRSQPRGSFRRWALWALLGLAVLGLSVWAWAEFAQAAELMQTARYQAGMRRLRPNDSSLVPAEFAQEAQSHTARAWGLTAVANGVASATFLLNLIALRQRARVSARGEDRETEVKEQVEVRADVSRRRTAFYYVRSGVRMGPVTSTELRRLASSGGLAATDLVWREGWSEWVQAGRMKGLFN